MKKIFNKINILIATLIIVGTFLIYSEKWFNQSGFIFSRYFFYLPIVLAGAYYGIGIGIFVSSLSAFSFAPLLLLEIEKNGLSYKGIEYILTLVIFFLVGIISGLFCQKNNSIKRFYKSLYQIEKVFNNTNGIDEILIEINNIFSSSGSFFVYQNNGLFSILNKEKDKDVQETKNVRLEGDRLISQLITNKKDFVSTNISFDPRIQISQQNSELSFCYLSVVPVIHSNQILGLIGIETNQVLAKENINLLKAVAHNLALNFQNKKLYKFVLTDKLTRINNRRYFDIYLTGQIQNYGQTLYLLMIDIDFFKKVNDSFGHPKGDEVLIKTADLIKNFSNPHLAFRIGGEEFAVVVNNLSQEQVLAMAENIRCVCEKNLFYLLPDRQIITISIGIASYPKDAKNTEDLFEKADQALYRAKENGRNRVEIY